MNRTSKVFPVQEKENIVRSVSDGEWRDNTTIRDNGKIIKSPREQKARGVSESVSHVLELEENEHLVQPDILPRMRCGTVLYHFEPENPGELAVETN